jgi:hypothetical protein
MVSEHHFGHDGPTVATSRCKSEASQPLFSRRAFGRT